LTIELSDKQKEDIFNFIRENVTLKYDWVYVVTRGFNIVFGTKIVNIRNRYNCDELIVEAFRASGINLADNDIKLSPETLSKSEYLRKCD
jgi:hypothetical protein